MIEVRSSSDPKATLESTTSFEATLERAKLQISRVNNSCAIIVPIDTLPPEILTRIFQLVNSQRRYYDEASRTELYLKRPEILSHVCSRWRQITVGFRGLWNHIGLLPFHPGLLARGGMFATRADPLPLEIHVVTGKSKSRLHEPDNNLNAFCASVAPRLSSLKLWKCEGVMLTHLSLLKACFSSCVPGTFEHLNLRGHFADSVSSYSFIDAEIYSHSRSQLLNVPNQHFEDLLLQVKVLRLLGVFLPWHSQAYHGLVELTIGTNFTHSSASITEPQLIGILAASPMLREFNFGIRVTKLERGDPSPSITLNELRSLSLGFTDNSQRKRLLRMISPGSKPLQMTIRFHRVDFPSQPDTELEEFLARANVTELHIKSRQTRATLPNIPKLLRSSPSLRNLILQGYNLNSDSYTPEPGHLPAGLCLESLGFVSCTIDLTQLLQIVVAVPISRMLSLGQGCSLSVQGSPLKPEEYRSKLSEVFPVIKLDHGDQISI